MQKSVQGVCICVSGCLTVQKGAKSAAETGVRGVGDVAAIVVAAGRGSRAGPGLPKQFRALGGEPVLRTALKLLAGHPEVARVQPVIHPDDRAAYRAAAEGLDLLPPVVGGATRQASVLAGLDALAPRAPGIVLVHDAARPFATPALVSRAIAAGRQHDAAIPVLPVADTVKRVDDAGRVEATLDRGRLRLVQTPQAFGFAALLEAHRKAVAQGRHDFTDDAALAEWAGMSVATFAGEPGNTKLTTADDLARAQMQRLNDIRTGMGVDVHAFGPGDRVTLGGVVIPHDRALSGHSDADVVLHAIVDAILGALADGDIGVHFPPSDPQWRGASSDRFVAFAMERLRARNGVVGHLDISIVCEAPKIGPHRDAMRARIAALCGVTTDRVGIQATTSEKLGFIGRGEGIVAYATATIRLPA
jgi:2-C-methyl-D-erythritol 4-phosphate cytidylyltransferase/2-C-methyl-D-erythritol 2,4-cyclodiphosphate synthase